MRYEKQEKVIGKTAQEDLQHKKVVIVGLGALGSVVAESLVRAGIGKLLLIDGDLVEVSNLHRQQLYTEADAKSEVPKVYAAKEALKKINDSCEIDTAFMELTPENAESILKEADLVMDGTDNLATRYVMNETCFQLNIPWIYGAASGTVGSYFSFVPNKTPCLRCVFGEKPEAEGLNCSTVGVLPAVTQYIASMQFNEAMKYLTGHDHLMVDQLERFDLWHNTSFKLRVRKIPNCPCQQPNKQKTTVVPTQPFDLKVLCGKEVIMARMNRGIQSEQPEKWLLNNWDKQNITYQSTPYFHTARIQGVQVRLFQDGRIYFYKTEKEKAKDILLQWMN